MHRPVLNPRSTVAICAALLMVFASLSWTAARTKNATVDEPGHALSGWLMWRHADFRLAPENPSLWQLWAALPNVHRDLKLQFTGKVFSDRSFDSPGGIRWVRQMLYQTPGNDGESLVERSRAMMLILGVLLGVMIGYWAFRLNGSVAAIIAVGLFSFDPNFIAHASLVKSDVMLALVMLGLSYAAWRLGQKGSLTRVMCGPLLCGIGMNTKFSGIVFLPIVAALLLVRALLPLPWQWQWRRRNTTLHSRGFRLLAALVVLSVTSAGCAAVTWASYGFRLRPAAAKTSQLDMPAIRVAAITKEAGSSLNPPRLPTPAEMSAWKPGMIVRFVDVADRHHWLPQAWLGGLLFQHACMQAWPSFLMGRRYETGAWYYFPMTVLFKTPSATLAAFLFALATILFYCKRWARAITDSKAIAWSAICIVLPAAIFFGGAIGTHLNIGLRLILAVYPPMFVGGGVMLSQLIQRRPRSGRALLVALAGLLLTETLPAWPNFISFFNFPSDSQRQGFSLLGDSNLDWGQDLTALAQWHQEHPETPIFLHYFGVADPAFFSPAFHTFEVTRDGDLVSDIPVRGGVLAVSATNLQGLYNNPGDSEFYQRLGQHPPEKIVGGSIYLYRNPSQ